jgi:hypothetical protein
MGALTLNRISELLMANDRSRASRAAFSVGNGGDGDYWAISLLLAPKKSVRPRSRSEAARNFIDEFRDCNMDCHVRGFDIAAFSRLARKSKTLGFLGRRAFLMAVAFLH